MVLLNLSIINMTKVLNEVNGVNEVKKSKRVKNVILDKNLPPISPISPISPILPLIQRLLKKYQISLYNEYLIIEKEQLMDKNTKKKYLEHLVQNSLIVKKSIFTSKTFVQYCFFADPLIMTKPEQTPSEIVCEWIRDYNGVGRTYLGKMLGFSAIMFFDIAINYGGVKFDVECCNYLKTLKIKIIISDVMNMINK